MGQSSGAPFDPRRVRRALFIRTDRLGETLLNLPAIAALKAGLPWASVTLLVQPELTALLARLPGVDEVWADEAQTQPWWAHAIRLAGRLRRGRFDLAIVSNPKKSLHLGIWLAGIRWRVGYGRKWGGLLTHRLADRKGLGERHEVQYNLDLLQPLGLPTTAPPCRLPISDEDDRQVRAWLGGALGQPGPPLVVVHPWTSNPAKCWPAPRYRELIERLARRLSASVVVIGGSDERAHLPAVLSDGLPVTDLVGRLTLAQSAALLARASVLVSNDSGPVHLAAAVGSPTVVLFGTSDPAAGPRRWGPWGAGHAVICRPSINEITVDEVFDRTVEQLKRRAGPASEVLG